MSARVCVAISVKNGRGFLASAVESVLAQELADLELRIYDNGSTDGSDALAREFLADPRVRFAANDRDLGYYGSLNRALAETDAEYFVPFAADDLMAPANLARKVALLDVTGAAFAHSPVRLIDPAGADIGELGAQPDARELYPAPEFFLRCTPINCITCPSVVARVDALRAIGGFDGRVPYCADWLAWMRLALRGGVAMAHEKLVDWRQHPDSGTSASLRSASYAIEDPAALRRALADPAFPSEWAFRRDGMLAVCLGRLATHLERDGHRLASRGPAAAGMAVEALSYAPAEAALRDLVRALAAAAGVAPPAVPLALVALPGADPAVAVEAVRLARRLARGGALERLTLTVTADRVADVAGPVGGELEAGGDLDVDLVAADDPAPLLVPGVIAVASAGSAEAALAEARGVLVAGVLPTDPFEAAPDLGTYQSLDPAEVR